MWTEAAAWLARYDEVVVTARGRDGYPISVRQDTRCYDAGTGTMPVHLPDVLYPVAGAANLLCHEHDESLWNLRAIHLRGRLERRGADWTFVSTEFNRPPRLAFWRLSRRMRASSRRYLARRGLATPEVNWSAVAEIWDEVRGRRST